MKSVGLFGGTFDPVHKAHLQLAGKAQKRFGLDQVVFIPAASPPHKSSGDISPFHHRVAMLQIALAGKKNFTLSQIEKSLPLPCYTVYTLQTMLEIHPAEYFFIIGIDAFLEIHLWKDFRKVLDMVHFIVSARRGYSIDILVDFMEDLGYIKYDNHWEALKSARKVMYLDTEILGFSSSEIRSKIQNEENTAGMLSADVREYIQHYSLY